MQHYFAGISQRDHKSSQVASIFIIFSNEWSSEQVEMKYYGESTRSLLFIRRPLESGGPCTNRIEKKTLMTMFTKIVDSGADKVNRIVVDIEIPVLTICDNLDEQSSFGQCIKCGLTESM